MNTQWLIDHFIAIGLFSFEIFYETSKKYRYFEIRKLLVSMHPLTFNDRESEISYAYLHAVASHMGAGCQIASRAADGNGIDAQITGWGPFAGLLQEVDLKVQLKATTGEPKAQNGYLSYFLKGINRYNDLRSDTLAIHRILVVMFLPAGHADWLTVNENELLLKKCAYWVSLRGAPATANQTGETVYIPQAQIFNTSNLLDIFTRLSRGERLTYTAP